MTKFVCKNCGFRFEKEKADTCPYCDRKSVEREQTAEELVESVESE